MKNSTILRTAFGAAMAATMALSTPAIAMDPGYCAPTAQFSAEMRAENQKPLVTAGRVNGGAFSPIQIFASNAEGDGYLIEGDRPMGQTSENMCVTLKLADIKLYDARNNEIPAELFTGGGYDETLRKGKSNGYGIAITATVIQDGQRVAKAVVDANPIKNLGGLDFILPNGQARSKATFENITYTPTADALLRSRTQTASLALNN